jgi:two-component system nitrogen regulation response regulator NtrX
MARILVVDDEANIRKMLKDVLSDEGYETETAVTAEEALERLRAQPGVADAVLLDLALPGMQGVEALPLMLALQDPPAVVMMSGHGTIETALKCARLGAYDFIEKPFNPTAKLLILVKNALQSRRLAHENAELQSQLGTGELVGESEPMRRLLQEIRKAGQSQARILVQGENGTGKELAARAIHRISPRADGPFVRLNCAAIPRDLIESELFGHERGAFTGAVGQKRGRFEVANGGTLFLDEIGDMSLETQAKLLRVLEENEMERVGGTDTIALDARVVAASNKNLVAEIRRGAFREDLFFRLAVIIVTIPPLRERGSDIVLLAQHFLQRYCESNGRRPRTLTPAAGALLAQYSWPGNVRELRNMMERVVIMLDEDRVEPAQLLPLLLATSPDGHAEALGGTLSENLDTFERGLIERALAASNGNIAQAARTLGLDRANLHRKLRRFGILSRPESR